MTMTDLSPAVQQAASAAVDAMFGPVEQHYNETNTNGNKASENVDKGDSGADRGTTPTYEVRGGCLYWNKPQGRDGHDAVKLATFDAEITEQVTRDDGSEQTLAWKLTVTASDEKTGEVEITPDQLGRPQQWATRAVGLSALVMPGMAIADHVRAAVQSRSTKATVRTVYGHTGWRKLGGEWAYLTSAGALKATGLDASVTVDLGTLSGYALAGNTGNTGFGDETPASIALLGLAPDEVMVPLLASVYRAPLPLAADCSVWLYGLSGTFKSAITALMQQHFGATMDAQGLPGNWTSTANALEQQAHVLDGALFVVDDYSPDATEADARRRAAAADRLLRGSANHAGRGRMRPDGTMRPDKPPRAQVLTSAEDVPPPIESLRARLLVAEITPGCVNVAKLSTAQQQAAEGCFARAMAGYVRWLAKQYDTEPEWPAKLTALRNTYRDKARAEGQHPRVALNVASLTLGWSVWLDYATENRAITEEEADGYRQRAFKVLCDIGAAQERYRHDSDPVQVYLGALGSLVASRKAYLVTPKGDCPNPPERWGWVRDANGPEYRPAPGAVLIGCTEGDDVFLLPSVAFAEARRFAEAGNTPLNVGKVTVHKHLNEKNMLASRTAKDQKLTTKKTIGGTQRDVLHLTVASFESGGVQ